MGLSCSRKYKAKIAMIGLDNAGKTAILYRLKLDEFVDTVPTIGFNDEKLDFGNIQFNIWDVGGKEEMRRLWKHYVGGALAIVFVVDATDHARMRLAAEELAAVLSEEDLSSAVVLVLANKQDLPGAMGPMEVANELRLHSINQRWFVQPTEAVEGNGLQFAFERLSDALLKYHFRPDCCSCQLPCICL